MTPPMATGASRGAQPIRGRGEAGGGEPGSRIGGGEAGGEGRGGRLWGPRPGLPLRGGETRRPNRPIITGSPIRALWGAVGERRHCVPDSDRAVATYIESSNGHPGIKHEPVVVLFPQRVATRGESQAPARVGPGDHMDLCDIVRRIAAGERLDLERRPRSDVREQKPRIHRLPIEFQCPSPVDLAEGG